MEQPDIQNMNSPQLLLDYERAAEALCMSKQALRDLVYKGRGPRTVNIGRRVFFAVSDLTEFVAAHREPD